MAMKMVDTNYWFEVFDDTKYDADDLHVKVEVPKSVRLSEESQWSGLEQCFPKCHYGTRRDGACLLG